MIASLSALFLRIVGWGFGRTGAHAQANFQKQVIDTICRHIAKTAGRDVTLTEAARISGYSKFHFLRLFKHETGRTFHGYVDDCRYKQASACFKNEKPKTGISATPGFSHPSALLRWIKAYGRKP